MEDRITQAVQFFESIDYPLLKEQKIKLSEVKTNLLQQEQFDAIEGVLYLLDAIEDIAKDLKLLV